MGQVSIREGPGAWPFRVKGHQQTWRTDSASERVLVFKFQLCSGPLVLYVWVGEGIGA